MERLSITGAGATSPHLTSRSLARDVVLPTQPRSHGTSRDLLAYTCNLITKFVLMTGDQVINHCADVRQTLRLGQSISGLLLGVSMEPIPDEFRTGRYVTATVVIEDQFSREYRAEVSLFINKQEKYRRRVSSVIRRRGGLFEKRDRITSPNDQRTG